MSLKCLLCLHIIFLSYYQHTHTYFYFYWQFWFWFLFFVLRSTKPKSLLSGSSMITSRSCQQTLKAQFTYGGQTQAKPCMPTMDLPVYWQLLLTACLQCLEMGVLGNNLFFMRQMNIKATFLWWRSNCIIAEKNSLNFYPHSLWFLTLVPAFISLVYFFLLFSESFYIFYLIYLIYLFSLIYLCVNLYFIVYYLCSIVLIYFQYEALGIGEW